jgi:hypothetical protein
MKSFTTSFESPNNSTGSAAQVPCAGEHNLAGSSTHSRPSPRSPSRRGPASWRTAHHSLSRSLQLCGVAAAPALAAQHQAVAPAHPARLAVGHPAHKVPLGPHALQRPPLLEVASCGGGIPRSAAARPASASRRARLLRPARAPPGTVPEQPWRTRMRPCWRCPHPPTFALAGEALDPAGPLAQLAGGGVFSKSGEEGHAHCCCDRAADDDVLWVWGRRAGSRWGEGGEVAACCSHSPGGGQGRSLLRACAPAGRQGPSPPAAAAPGEGPRSRSRCAAARRSAGGARSAVRRACSCRGAQTAGQRAGRG